MHTKQVCSGTVTAVMGTTQSDMYSSLQDYLGKDESEFFFGFIRPGPLMVVISIVVWSLSIMSELSSTLTIVLAVCRLPIGAGRPLVETGEDDALKMVHVTRCRKYSFILLQLVRFGIVVLLFYTGCIYLVRTTVIADLFYNMAALAFILDMDELIFAALVPLHVKTTLYRRRDDSNPGLLPPR